MMAKKFQKQRPNELKISKEKQSELVVESDSIISSSASKKGAEIDSCSLYKPSEYKTEKSRNSDQTSVSKFRSHQNKKYTPSREYGSKASVEWLNLPRNNIDQSHHPEFCTTYGGNINIFDNDLIKVSI
jgi:hypothetical protein